MGVPPAAFPSNAGRITSSFLPSTRRFLSQSQHAGIRLPDQVGGYLQSAVTSFSTASGEPVLMALLHLSNSCQQAVNAGSILMNTISGSIGYTNGVSLHNTAKARKSRVSLYTLHWRNSQGTPFGRFSTRGGNGIDSSKYVGIENHAIQAAEE